MAAPQASLVLVQSASLFVPLLSVRSTTRTRLDARGQVAVEEEEYGGDGPLLATTATVLQCI